jgi:hypothetical protein
MNATFCLGAVLVTVLIVGSIPEIRNLVISDVMDGFDIESQRADFDTYSSTEVAGDCSRLWLSMCGTLIYRMCSIYNSFSRMFESNQVILRCATKILEKENATRAQSANGGDCSEIHWALNEGIGPSSENEPAVPAGQVVVASVYSASQELNVRVEGFKHAMVDQFVQMLDACENTSPHAFCFYRCIRHNDRHSFLSQFLARHFPLARQAPIDYVAAMAYLSAGGMGLEEWMRVMNACQVSGALHNNYELMVPMGTGLKAVGRYDCSQPSNAASTVRILFSHNHLQTITDDPWLSYDRTVCPTSSSHLRYDVSADHNEFDSLTQDDFDCSQMLLAWRISIPFHSEHKVVMDEIKRSSAVAKFKNFEVGNPLLAIRV